MRVASILFGLVVIGNLRGPFTSRPVLAAPPQSGTKSALKASVDDTPEIPAVPYLTLALVRDPSVHAELELKSTPISAGRNRLTF